jgi:D-galacturonate reductase
MFDLRRRGKVDKIALVGVNGSKFPGIRQHMQRAIGDVYAGLDLGLATYPADHAVDPHAYLRAIDDFQAGDVMTIFTPDDTHFDIALAAVKKGIHVLITKPAVKTLADHRLLHEEAAKHNVLVSVEVHKRWDPIYIDARDKIRTMGAFSYMYAYMSQPKHQLETFKAWAGKSSDISYYLNSHHVDFHEWAVGEVPRSPSQTPLRPVPFYTVSSTPPRFSRSASLQASRPVTVTATASRGVADQVFGIAGCEDTITLTVQWENLGGEGATPSTGTAVYTSSWVAPKSDVHSQQRFFYMGHGGEVTIDQAHRGYTVAQDGAGFKSANPLFMKYTPTNGRFSGQHGYGYRSFEAFVDAAQQVRVILASFASCRPCTPHTVPVPLLAYNTHTPSRPRR